MGDRALRGVDGPRARRRLGSRTAAAWRPQQGVRLDSYAEWKRDGDLVVDGQRVRASAKTKWKGKYTSVDDVPLGDEVRVQGLRQADGVVLASRDRRPAQRRQRAVRVGGADRHRGARGGVDAEQAGVRARGQRRRSEKIGEVADAGPDVDRVRRLVNRLAPPYVPRDQLRVYVIDNKEWNAMAMGNGAIWVFSGIMQDMPDDQLAIVVGHELAHYTHEHSRRQARRGDLDADGGRWRRSSGPRPSTTMRRAPARSWARRSACRR